MDRWRGRLWNLTARNSHLTVPANAVPTRRHSTHFRIIQQLSGGEAKPLAASSRIEGLQYVALGLGLSSGINMIGGILHGWPAINMSRYSAQLGMISVMTIVLTAVVMSGVTIIMKVKSPFVSRLPPPNADQILLAEMLIEEDERQRRKLQQQQRQRIGQLRKASKRCQSPYARRRASRPR